MADARCRLAETERDWTSLAAELPKLVAYHNARLARYQDLQNVGALNPADGMEAKAVGEALQKAEHRLEIVRTTLGPP